jgi:hypothetical protein
MNEGSDGREQSSPDPEGGRPPISDESGIIVFGGGNGCAGRGCLFWIVASLIASVVLTVLVNLILLLFSSSGSGPAI